MAPGLKVNMDGVTTGFPTLDEGIYEAILGSWKVDKIKNGDNAGLDMVIAEFNITTGPDGMAVENRKAWRNFPLLDKTLWVLKKFLVDLGMEEDSISGVEFDVEDAMNSVQGTPCRLRLSVGEYNGKKNNRVEEVISMHSSSPVAATATTKKRSF